MKNTTNMFGENVKTDDVEVADAEYMGASSEEEAQVYEDELENELERLFRQGDEGIEMLDRAGEEFERSMDNFCDGLEKMFDSLEGMMELALKK